MGYNEMDQVWDKSQAARTDKLVLLAIARTYNVGKGSWPSQKTLARVCGINVRSVRRSIQALQDSGELVWVRGSNYSGKANLYYITVCEGAKMSAIVQPEMSAESAEMSAETNKNVRLLNKQLNKLDKSRKLVFSCVPGSEFWDVIAKARPDLSFVERKEFLESFADTWIAKNAYTDGKLVDACLAYLPSTKGNDE